jgi:hypothetical protein
VLAARPNSARVPTRAVAKASCERIIELAGMSSELCWMRVSATGPGRVFFEHHAPWRDSHRHRQCEGRWRGVISPGFGPDGRRVRRKVSGKTKAVAQDRLKTLHSDLDSGVRAKPNYTVQRAAED